MARKRVSIRMLGAGAAAVLIAALLASSSSAVGGDAVPSERQNADPSELMGVEEDSGTLVSDPEVLQEADAQAYAKTAGIDVDVARDRLARQVRSQSQVRAIADAHPEDFAGFTLDMETKAATVYFRGDPPDVEGLVADSADLTLVGNARYGATELAQLSQTVWQYYSDQGFRLEVRADLDDQVVVVVLDEQQAKPSPGVVTAEAVAEINARLTAKDVPDIQDANIELRSEPLPNIEHAWGYGGDRFVGTGNCTSGFSAYRPSTGKYGFLTAEHCDFWPGVGQTTYYHDGYCCSSYPTHTTTRRTGTYSGAGDGQFRTKSGRERDDFYYNPTIRRDVQSVAETWEIADNMTVCRFGRSSNANECSDVTDVTTVNSNGITIFRVGPTTMQGGDSGGPVFDHREALGITHGYGCLEVSPVS